ncbi:hypothetical protein B0H13DRAFT_1865170 [Mycena leptocephala]|nr:hypothetical protein B0H13DRAFT_1865170 [Mycena leptocephala]
MNRQNGPSRAAAAHLNNGTNSTGWNQNPNPYSTVKERRKATRACAFHVHGLPPYVNKSPTIPHISLKRPTAVPTVPPDRSHPRAASHNTTNSNPVYNPSTLNTLTPSSRYHATFRPPAPVHPQFVIPEERTQMERLLEMMQVTSAYVGGSCKKNWRRVRTDGNRPANAWEVRVKNLFWPGAGNPTYEGLGDAFSDPSVVSGFVRQGWERLITSNRLEKCSFTSLKAGVPERTSASQEDTLGPLDSARAGALVVWGSSGGIDGLAQHTTGICWVLPAWFCNRQDLCVPVQWDRIWITQFVRPVLPTIPLHFKRQSSRKRGLLGISPHGLNFLTLLPGILLGLKRHLGEKDKHAGSPGTL